MLYRDHTVPRSSAILARVHFIKTYSVKICFLCGTTPHAIHRMIKSGYFGHVHSKHGLCPVCRPIGHAPVARRVKGDLSPTAAGGTWNGEPDLVNWNGDRVQER